MFPIDRNFTAIGEILTKPVVDFGVTADPARQAIIDASFSPTVRPKILVFEHSQLTSLSTPSLVKEVMAFEAQIFRLVIREVEQDLNIAKQISTAIIARTTSCHLNQIDDLLDVLEDVGINFSEHVYELRKGASCYTELARRFDETLKEASISNPKKVREFASQIIKRHIELREGEQESNPLEVGIDFLFQLATKVMPMARIINAINTQAQREQNPPETNPYKVSAVRFLA